MSHSETAIDVMNRYSTTGLLLVFSLLAGCFGWKSYPNTLEKNLHIQTETESGSFFSTVRADVDIYRVNGSCNTEYQGTVNLSSPSVEVGLHPDQASYLIFNFASSSFIANSRSTISYDTLLTPRAGHHYDIKVRYVDDIYNVEIRETHPGNPASLDIERQDLRACRAV